jgi:enoyl-CoA hydratase
MRADRAAVYAQHDLPLEAALTMEFTGGMPVMGEAVAGARRFAHGEGRHGG